VKISIWDSNKFLERVTEIIGLQEDSDQSEEEEEETRDETMETQ
jgi:hypothetical protein